MAFDLTDQGFNILLNRKSVGAAEVGNLGGFGFQLNQKISQHFSPPLVEHIIRPVQVRALDKRAQLPEPVFMAEDIGLFVIRQVGLDFSEPFCGKKVEVIDDVLFAFLGNFQTS